MTDLVQRLRNLDSDQFDSYVIEITEDAACRIEQLERENAELRKDAERYRWARNALADKENGVSHWFFCIGRSEELDAAIDEAMK